MDKVRDMAAQAMARHDLAAACSPSSSTSTTNAHEPAASVTVPPPRAGLEAPAIAIAAPSSAPPTPRTRLPRERWLKQQLETERLQRRTREYNARKRSIEAHKAATLPGSELEVWGPAKTERLLRASAAVRARSIEARPAAVRAQLREQQANPATAHFVIGYKRICDALGWSPIDPWALRLWALILLLRELAIPHCWNAHAVRRPPRRGSRRMSQMERLSIGGGGIGVRHYTPCVRALAQTAIAEVLAAAGHCDDDDRSCSTKTVQRALRLLEGVDLVQAVQVPAHAAESWELGRRDANGERWSFARYYLATPGSPKPALMGWWSAEDTCGREVLARPWAGATPRPAEDPPPLDA